MRKVLTLWVVFLASLVQTGLHAQDCFSTGVNGQVINIPCTVSCAPINLKVNDLRSSSSYTLSNIPYAPMPFTSAGATEITQLYIDDKFSPLFTSPFPICFYDSAFTRFIVGSNGVVTFDQAQANCNNAWKLEQNTTTPVPIPFTGTQECTNSTGPKYPPYSIMTPYHDINPGVTSTSPNRKIEWRLYGLPPCRKVVVNFFEIPLFGHTSQLNTSQLVIYENTGVFDIFIRDKRIDTDGSIWNSNLAILGIQKDATTAHPAPGKNATVWEEFNTGYRYTPSGGTTRFQKSELLTLSGTLLQTVNASSAVVTTPGQLDISFSNICPSNPVTQYLVRTYYSVCSPTSSSLIITDTITVNAVPPLTGTATTTNPSCQGASNGTITVVPSSTVGGPFQYSIDNGATWQSSPTFTGLAAGTYTLLFRNNDNCVSSPITATINPGTPLTATVAVTNASCFGSATGSATVTVSNSGNFSYSLDNITFQASNNFTGLAAGNYTAYFQEPSGCSGSQTFTISQPTDIQLSAASQPVICNGQANGLITITASGGTGALTYSINGTTYQSSPVFNVAAGNYTASVRDQNGCIKSVPVDVTEPAALSATYTVTNASCDGGADGTITIQASGGTGAYSFSINGSYQSSNVFYVGQGTYTFTVKDGNECVLTVPNVTVGLTNNLVVTPSPDPAPICESKSVTLQPNTNATQFSWTPSTGLSASNIKNPVAAPLTTTTYYLTATLGVCTAYDTITVTVRPAPIPNAGPDGDICYGQSYTLQGSGGVSYSWGPAASFNGSQAQQNPTVTPAQTTTYDLHVVDQFGCNSLQPDLVTVKVTPPIVVKATKDTIVSMGDTFQLYANSAATDYVWSPSAGLSDPYISNPVVTVTGDITYIVTATTSAGCKGEATVKLTVFNGPDIYVPSGFTPNGDGRNDIFRPFPVGIKKINYFRVFNRWGQLIYSTSQFNQGWDGTINGQKQGTGTYVWMVEGVTKEDKIIRKKGTVVLIR